MRPVVLPTRAPALRGDKLGHLLRELLVVVHEPLHGFAQTLLHRVQGRLKEGHEVDDDLGKVAASCALHEHERRVTHLRSLDRRTVAPVAPGLAVKACEPPGACLALRASRCQQVRTLALPQKQRVITDVEVAVEIALLLAPSTREAKPERAQALPVC